MPIEKKALKFISQLEKDYFERRDLDAVLNVLDEDVRWVGTGPGEIVRGIAEAKAVFEQEQAGFAGAFSILDTGLDASALSKELCLVQGWVQLRPKREEGGEAFVLRLSALCKELKGQMSLLQVHLSMASPDQLDMEFFPKVLSKREAAALRKRVEEQQNALQQSSQDLDALMNNIPGGVMCCDASEQLVLLQYSDGFLAMFGYAREDLEARFSNQFIQMIYEPDRAAWAAAAARLQGSEFKEMQYRVICKDGSLLWVLSRGQRVVREDGSSIFYCILIDITETKKAQEELRLSLERHQIIMDQAEDIIFEWDIAEDTLLFSSNWHKKFGYTPVTEHIGKYLPGGSHIHPADGRIFLELMKEIAGGTPYKEADFRISKADGKYIWCRIRASLQKDSSGRPAKAVGVISDIDAQKQEAQKLQEKAERDALTGLYNKGAAQQQIEQYLHNCSSGGRSAFFIVDVDDFKIVNDVFGHLSGDVMLSDMAGALQNLFRSADVVGRIGGDEFAVFMQGIHARRDAERKAKEILDSFRALFKEDYHVSCSIGIAFAPEDGASFLELYKKADIALYHAKAKGKNSFACYAPGLAQPQTLAFQQREAVGDKIESSRSETSIGSLAEYVFHALYQAGEVEEAIPQILEIIGKQMDVSRVYIFEDSEDGSYCKNTFEWCNRGIEPQKEILQHVSYAYLGDYYANFNEDGIFYCRDIQGLTTPQKETLEQQNVKSVLQCIIKDSGKNKGFVGFDECRVNCFWTQEQVDVLSFIAEILGVFLLKKRAQVRAEQVLACVSKVLDYQDSWIYVVDYQTRELLYANRKIMQLLPDLKIGEIAPAFFGEERLRESLPDHAGAEGKLYSPLIGRVVLVKTTPISWVGSRVAYLFTCQDAEAVIGSETNTR